MSDLSSLSALIAPRKELIHAVASEVMEKVKATITPGTTIHEAPSHRSSLVPLLIIACLNERIVSAISKASSSEPAPNIADGINSAFAVLCVIDRFLNPNGLLKEFSTDSDNQAVVKVVGSVLRASLGDCLLGSLWDEASRVIVEVSDPVHLQVSVPSIEEAAVGSMKASSGHQSRCVHPVVREFVKRAESLVKKWENDYSLHCALRGVRLVLTESAINAQRQAALVEEAAAEEARLEEQRKKDAAAEEEAAREAAKTQPTITKVEVLRQLQLIRTIKRLLSSKGSYGVDRVNAHLPKHRVSHYLSRLQRILDSYDQEQARKDAESEGSDEEYVVDRQQDDTSKVATTKVTESDSLEAKLRQLHSTLVREMSEQAAKAELAAMIARKGPGNAEEVDEMGEGAEEVQASKEEELLVVDDPFQLSASGSAAKLPVYYSPFNIITDVQQHTTLARRLPGGGNPSRAGYPIHAGPSIVGSFVSYPRAGGKAAAEAGYTMTPHGAKIPAGNGRTKVILNEIEDNRKFSLERGGLTKCLSYEDQSYDSVVESVFDLLWRTTGLTMRPPGAPHPGPFKVTKNKGIKYAQFQREMGVDPDHPGVGNSFSPLDGSYLRADPRIDRRVNPFSWREVMIFPPAQDGNSMTTSTAQSPTPFAEWLALQKISAEMNLGGSGGILSGSIFERGIASPATAVETVVTVAQRCWFQTFDQWEMTVDAGRIPTLRERVVDSNAKCIVGGRNTMLGEYAALCGGSSVTLPTALNQPPSTAVLAPANTALSAAGAKRPREQ